VRIVTIAPLSTPLRLKPGVDPRSDVYAEILAALPPDSDTFRAPNRAAGARRAEYESLDEDGYDLRLAVFEPEADGGARARFHIYANGVAIAEVHLDPPETYDAESLEADVQARTRAVIDRHAGELGRLLKTAMRRIPKRYGARNADFEGRVGDDVSWIARTLLVTEAERRDAEYQTLIERWLAHTTHPEKAAAIAAGEADYSITWLNYVIVDSDSHRTWTLISAMRIAQFFYASQNATNDRIQRAIARASFMKNVREAEALLVDARARTQMLRIQYGLQRNYLPRMKRAVVDQIMAVWDFDDLVENGRRMIEVSSEQITLITTRRSERNSFITDMILVGIALLAVVEVSLYFTEYSREVMSRPALAYRDEEMSWILSAVAGIDADDMLLGGAISVLILVALYAFSKSRR